MLPWQWILMAAVAAALVILGVLVLAAVAHMEGIFIQCHAMIANTTSRLDPGIVNLNDAIDTV